MNYLEDLTLEELILFIILDKLKNNYEVLPRIIFYEQFLTINNDKIILRNKEQTGYSEIDYIIYSKNDYNYKDEIPFIFQTCYYYNETRVLIKNKERYTLFF